MQLCINPARVVDMKEMVTIEERKDISQLIYHTSDFTVTAIVDNPKVGHDMGASHLK